MHNIVRLAAISSALAITLACGAPNEQQGAPPQGSAPTTPEVGTTGTTPGTPAATPGSDMRGQASSVPAASAAPPPPVMMAMDVPSGTELSLILETAVSSETAKPEQTVHARVAKPVVIAGMTIIPEGAPVTGTVVSAER